MASFLKKIFGGEDAEVEFDDFDKPAPHSPSALPAAPVADGDLPVELLDAILDIINAQLPPIAAQCIDRSAQRRYLAAALGRPLAAIAESLKSNASAASVRREEQKAALLSEQRQRRALAERNRDLEAKINELDSQIEQYKLTVASMTNKMRVAEVTEGNASALREEIAALRSQLDEKDETIKKLKEEAKAAPADAERKPRKPRQRKQYVPAADDSAAGIDSLDWLLPGGAPAGHVGHVSDPEFGYQPPKQAPAPDSNAQLTLF